MRLLLDTHVFLWWIEDDSRLPSDARKKISDFGNEVFVSAASAWEIEIKAAIGKLQIDPQWKEHVEGNGFAWLPITPLHTEFLRGLPPIHRDPFDRMLVAQSRCEGLELLSFDSKVNAYLESAADQSQ